ncbi:hypothetical protein N7475_003687 [Penicillium sp. IBT 31633x]|nr:hypothetical protein N7475_003687 [Penicillium sp. IBT 31633x]
MISQQRCIRAPSELALGSSPSQAAGTMDSYLLVVCGVNPRGGDQIESAVVVRFGPVREATAQSHQNQGTTGYDNHPTSFYPTRTRAPKLVLHYQWKWCRSRKKTGHP